MADVDEGICSNDSISSDKDLALKAPLDNGKHVNGLCVSHKVAMGDNHIITKTDDKPVVLNGEHKSEHKISEKGDNSTGEDQLDSKTPSSCESPMLIDSPSINEDSNSNGGDTNEGKIVENGHKSPRFLDKAVHTLKDIQSKCKATPDGTIVVESSPEIIESDDSQTKDAAEDKGVTEEAVISNGIEGTAEEITDSSTSNNQNDKEMIDLNGDKSEHVVEDDIEDMVESEKVQEKPSDTNEKEDNDEKEKINEDELLNASIEEGIHMEIGSDNEDDILMSDEPIENKTTCEKPLPSNDKDDCISFDDDSNSNTNSDKVQDAIKILSNDLSGTNSPVTVAEKENDDNSQASQSQEVIELNDSDLDVNKVTEEQKHNDVEEEKLGHTIDNSESKEGNHDDTKTETETVKNDSEEIVEIDISPEKSPKHLNSEETKEKGDENNESVIDCDDDVIFKGESKLEYASEEIVKSENDQTTPKTEDTTSELEKILQEEKPDIEKVDKGVKEEDNTKVNESSTIEIPDDDDVIFEKETKIEKSDKIENEVTKESEENVPMDTTKDTKVKEDVLPITNGDLSEDALNNCDTNDRKRPAEESEFKSSSCKRSKLDDNKDVPSMIAETKVETKADMKADKKKEEPASIELIDSDEDSDSSSNGRNVPKSRETYLRLQKKKEEKKTITLTKQELEDLVRTKVKEYLVSQRDKLLTQLTQKVQDFQSNNDLWKRQVKDLQVKVNDVTVLQQKHEKRKAHTAALRVKDLQVKDLQVKVNDVTVLQQKHEKRKAHTAALRQITTRNVGVQVDDGRTSKPKSVTSSPVLVGSPTRIAPRPPHSVTSPVVTAPPGANGMIRLPIPQSSLAPPVIQQQVVHQPPQIMGTDFKTPTVKTLLGTTRTQPTISSSPTSSGVPSAPVVSVQYPQRVVTHTPTTAATFIQLPPGSGTNTATKIVKTQGTGSAKIIDLTDDDQPRVIMSLPQGISGQAQAGVQVLNTPGQQLVRPGTFQLVLGPGNHQLRPGTIVTGLPQTFIQSLPGSAAPVNVNPQPSQTVLSTVRAPPPLQTLKPPVTAPDPPPALVHPAPFPSLPIPQNQSPSLKNIPSKPSLRVSRTNQGIVLSWNMTLTNNTAEVASYQLFAYQETAAVPHSSLWKKVGDVKALPLPMACTLTQFQVGNKYHFAVRALDVHGRVSPYSDPSSLHMTDSAPSDK